MAHDALLRTKVLVILALSIVAHLGRIVVGFALMEGTTSGSSGGGLARRRSKRVRDKSLLQRSSSLGEESDVDHFQDDKKSCRESRDVSSTPLFSFGMIADIQYVPVRPALVSHSFAQPHSS
jgi:hypothetical protein